MNNLAIRITCLIVSLLLLLYSVCGIAMAYWIASVPGNSHEHINLNFAFWGAAVVFSVSISLISGFSLWKYLKSRNDGRDA